MSDLDPIFSKLTVFIELGISLSNNIFFFLVSGQVDDVIRDKRHHLYDLR